VRNRKIVRAGKGGLQGKYDYIYVIISYDIYKYVLLQYIETITNLLIKRAATLIAAHPDLLLLSAVSQPVWRGGASDYPHRPEA
jgi:hypothetical protein